MLLLFCFLGRIACELDWGYEDSSLAQNDKKSVVPGRADLPGSI